MKDDEEFLEKLDKVVRETAAMQEALFVDAHKTAKTIVEGRSQTDYRHFVRAVMAYIEGMTFKLKEAALTFNYLELNEEVDERDLALLREEQYSLDRTGNPKTSPLRLPMKENVRFAINMFAKTFGLPPMPIFDSIGWNAICQTIEVRHRLTHPKKVGDLTVTKMEADLASTALRWHSECMKTLQSAAGEVFKRRTEEFEKQRKKAV